jgi:hypothetical protein
MIILKELKRLRKLLENKNYGDQLALWVLVNILIKYFEEKGVK